MNDEELLSRFEDCTLPYEEWTHRCHVKVAFLYVRNHEFNAAIEKIKHGIKSYNAAKGVEEGPTTGYNETTTVAFMHLVAATVAAHGATMPTPDADSFCDMHPQLMCRQVLRLFYSPARRSDPRTKSEFLTPDLCGLPELIK